MIAPTAAAVLEHLAHKDAQVLNLLALCRTPSFDGVWSQGPALHHRFARLLLRQGHPTLALQVAARGLDRYPGDPNLLYCRAGALVNSGNTTRAAWDVQHLLDRTDLPPALRSDALSLAGRVRKDVAARTAWLREAFDFYRQAYELTGDTFPGINAATLALAIAGPDQSRALAVGVRDGVLAELDQPGKEGDYWLLATLGEAYLLLGDDTFAKGRYRVFADVVSCADLALRLLRRLEGFDFASFGLRLREDKKPGVRIGLHTGPVFEGYDAVLGRNNYFGSHVSRAARIEPVTTPGCAFVSEQFAASLALMPGHDFVCEYLGLQPLDKDYAICPLYRLTSRADRSLPLPAV